MDIEYTKVDKSNLSTQEYTTCMLSWMQFLARALWCQRVQNVQLKRPPWHVGWMTNEKPWKDEKCSLKFHAYPYTMTDR